MKNKHDFPLNVLVIGMHHHGPQRETINARKLLRKSIRVNSFGSIDNLDEAYILITNGGINTIFLDPWVLHREGELVTFIRRIRKEFPFIVFVLYTNDYQYNDLLKEDPNLSHYFRLNSESLAGKVDSEEGEQMLIKCQESLYEFYNFDLAISFAGEDREIARELAEKLTTSGNRIFFDEYFESDLLGKDLYSHLFDIYSKEARYCLMVISKNYPLKKWTVHERKSAQTRSFESMGTEYILPIRLDNSPIPGIFSTTGYLNIDKGVDKISEIINNKLWLPVKFGQKQIIGNKALDYE